MRATRLTWLLPLCTPQTTVLNVINMSFGGTGFANDTTLGSAITYAYSKNVVMVAAAGNDTGGQGNDLDTSPQFPVCDNAGTGEIIGVAATDINDQKASFSDFGKTCVDVSAQATTSCPR